MDILLEQLVYGSFPFWERGYDVLARSPGCRAEWVAEVLAACRNLGEAPSGITPASALFALRLTSGPWTVVGVEPQGVDDRGRPGALAFHALVVDPADYRKAGSNPFAFAGALRRDWTAETTLTAVFCTVQPIPPAPPTDPRFRNVVEALARNRRVAIEATTPIETLAREVWPSLPGSTRRRASVATWAFGNANRFDLVGLPRLAGVELDRTYLEPGAIDHEPTATSRQLGPLIHGWNRLPNSVRWSLPAVALILLGLAWQAGPRPDSPEPSDRPIAVVPGLKTEDRAAILANLKTLADRFDLAPSNDPGIVLARLSEQFHYRGRILDPTEIARIADDPDPDRDQALAWHDRITRTFLDDHPLPGDFARLPLDRQLALVARSFHLDPLPETAEIPDRLIQALGRSGPIRPTPLAGRYPALSEYARFLGKLPRLEKRGGGQ